MLRVDVLPPPPQVEEKLRLAYKVFRFRVCETTIMPLIIDAAGVRHEYETSVRVAWGDHGDDEFTVERPIPRSATPGPARYRLTLSWRCPLNAIHFIWPIVHTYDDVPFVIAERKGSGDGR
ncbi:MAG: hypothetical protein HZY79_00480 [Rhodoblastus sp.]|nr:MAG: hypothetical protein HZY79_00480 [Rhodoblastus sp.]